MTTQHTPTPWTLNKRDRAPMIGFDVGDGGGLLPLVPEVHGFNLNVARANAAFIVTACNAHDALTAQNAALVAALRGLVKAEEDYGDEANVAINEALAPAYAALAAVGAK